MLDGVGGGGGGGAGGGGRSTPDNASTGFDDFNFYRLLFATVMAVKGRGVD